MDSLVTTEWLAAELAAAADGPVNGSGAGDLRIVDASWHLPGVGRDAAAEFAEGHIPGAVFMDLGELVDTASPVDNTLPSPEKFASRMQGLGLGDGSRIVVYDHSEVKSAARAWFMFRLFGASRVAILDGGLAKWQAEGRPLEAGRPSVRHRHYTAWSDAKMLRTKEEVLANIAACSEQLVDARGAPRFTGEEPEPRPGIASGHIPGAVNLPYKQLFNADGTHKDDEALARVFADCGIDLSRPVVATCGSGMTACVLAFGMHRLGKDDVALYDGSWSEWGADPDLPKAAGKS